MTRSRVISIDEAEEGMVVARDVLIEGGQCLLPSGAILIPKTIEALRRRGITEIHVVDSGADSQYTEEEILRAQEICRDLVLERFPPDANKDSYLGEFADAGLHLEALRYLSTGKLPERTAASSGDQPAVKVKRREQKVSPEEILKKVKDLPVLPAVVMEINRLLQSEEVLIEEVSAVIEKDSGLTAKILRLANSSYYGLSYHVDTLSRAITVLGLTTIRNLAMTVSIQRLMGGIRGGRDEAIGLWEHSLGCAVSSKALISKKYPALEEKAFIAGLLHDIGKVVLYQNFWEEMEEIWERIRSTGAYEEDLERETLGFTHSDVGALLASKWHFPPELTESIRDHHGLEAVSEQEPLRTAVYLGDQVARGLRLGRSVETRVRHIPTALWKLLGFEPGELRERLLGIYEAFSDLLVGWDLE